MASLNSLFACLVLAGSIWAGDVEAQQAKATPPAEAARPLPAEDLDAISGGQEIVAGVLSNQQLTAANSGNSVNANSVRSGDVNFSGSALNGFSGVGNFVVNTGNNNNLQGAISLNIISTLPVR
jgi:hypothetical protein